MLEYRKRVLDKVLAEELKLFGAVVINGPKWSGKTTTAKQIAKTVINFQDPLQKKNVDTLFTLNPFLILEGEKPLLIDEWQEFPEIWDVIRQDVDNKNAKGIYIMTGSSTVNRSKISHSGAGRITTMVMRTMSIYELGLSDKKVSLKELFEEKEDFTVGKSSLKLVDYANILVKGGFPGSIDFSVSDAQRQISGYIESIVNEELMLIDGVKRDPERLSAIMRSYARHISTAASDSAIIKDIESSTVDIHRNSFYSYINSLKNIYIIEEMKSWNPKLRSKAVVRTSNIRHFSDPAIAASLIGASSDSLIKDLETFGLLFESLVVRDLRVYAELLRGNVYHYRDSTGLEADAIILLDDGRWGAVEVKLGSNQLDQAASNLIKLKDKVDTRNKPSFLMIITATDIAYRREDGVYVVPLGTLMP